MSDERTPLISGSQTPLNDDSNLTKFRKAIGINAGEYPEHPDLETARKSAKGLYKDIINTQTWRGWQYRIVNVLFYLALGAQIIIGATLTALGPQSKLHPVSITILGVVNTSIASMLALFKGQGLPDRLRKDEFEMRKVQDYIEETETRLAVIGEDITDDELDQLLQTVHAKYNAARDTAQMNTYTHQGEGDVERRSRTGTLRTKTSKVSKNGKGKDAI